MSAPICRAPLDAQTLLAYWLGELDEAATAAVDEHLFGCEACGAELDALVALGAGVRQAFGAGLVAAVVGAGFVQRLAERGLQLRQYRVAPGTGVDCHVEPGDDLVVSRLDASLAGVRRLDMLLYPGDGTPVLRSEDIPFDPDAGEVVAVVSAARLRTLTSGSERCELLAVDEHGQRLVGAYTFNHHGPAA
ncbi:MAG: zf-HC2 domain-containing protein [Piscinibacter sp.]|nr:zf-HC2 domain-containing protein [Piscinibacter sp.]